MSAIRTSAREAGTQNNGRADHSPVRRLVTGALTSPGSVATGFGGRGAAGAEDWKLAPEDVAEVVIDLLAHPARSLPSRVEIRPSKPPKK